MRLEEIVDQRGPGPDISFPYSGEVIAERRALSAQCSLNQVRYSHHLEWNRLAVR